MAVTILRDVDVDTPLSVRDDILRVDWYNAGEGICGDYNPENPQDVNLLRFDVYIAGDAGTEDESDDGWREVEDASYCTNIPANTTQEILEESLKYIFSEYREVIDQYPYNSLKRLGERLSWISDSDFESEARKGAS